MNDRTQGNDRTLGVIMKKLLAMLALGATASSISPASAAVEYVKVCSTFGAQWAYIPGTDTCINLSSGETRTQTDSGVRQSESDLAGRVSDTEEGVAETNSQLDETNARLDKTNDKLAKTNERVDDLEQSYSDLEQRFENAFEESLDGVAIAMALSSPDLVAGERFAMKFNLGTYNGSNAFGFSVAGVLARTDFGRITLSGGVATTGDNTGGNVGMQFSW